MPCGSFLVPDGDVPLPGELLSSLEAASPIRTMNSGTEGDYFATNAS